jgi:hypothetical protein
VANDAVLPWVLPIALGQLSGHAGGTGTLLATARARLTVGVSPSGSGMLTASASARFPRAVALSGTGTLLAPARLYRTTVGVGLVGIGRLTVTAYAKIPVTTPLPGTGTLMATAVATRFTVTPAPHGQGLLTAAAFGGFGRPGVLAGTGVLSAPARISQIRLAVALSGHGVLSVNAYAKLTRSVTLNGTGSLVGSARLYQVREGATPSGTGTLTATAHAKFTVSAALSATGTLAAAPRPKLLIALVGHGVLSAMAETAVLPYRDANLTGSGTLTAPTTVGLFRVLGSLTGSGILIQTGLYPKFVRAAQAFGQGTLSATAQLYSIHESATLPGRGTPTAAVYARFSPLSPVSGHGSLITTAQATRFVLTAPLPGTGRLTVASYARFFRSAALTGHGIVSATALPIRRIAFSGNGALAAVAQATQFTLTVALTGRGTLVGTPLVMQIVSYGATGSGVTGATGISGNGTTISWPHTFGPTATGIIVGVSAVSISYGNASYTRAVQIGSTPLTLLGVQDGNNATTNGWVELWGLTGPSIRALAGTTQTVTATDYYTTTPTSNRPWMSGNSVSYFGVAGFGAAVLNSAAAAAISTGPVASALYNLVVSIAGNYAMNVAYTAMSGTTRFNNFVGGNTEGCLIQDAPGAASVTETVTGLNTPWATVAVNLASLALPSRQVPMSGRGVLSATAGRMAALSGQGVLSYTTNNRTAARSGHGVLSAGAVATKFSLTSSPLSGHGVASATTHPTFLRPVPATGKGVLSATIRLYQTARNVALGGTGVLSGTVFIESDFDAAGLGANDAILPWTLPIALGLTDQSQNQGPSGQGQGPSGQGTTVSWLHAFGPDATALLVGVGGMYADAGSSYTAYTRNVVVGSTSLTLLGAINNNNSLNGWVELWGLAGPVARAWAGTTQTVSVWEYATAVPTSTPPKLDGNSVSYKRVAALGAVGQAWGNSAVVSTGPISSAGDLVASVISVQDSGGTGLIPISPSGIGRAIAWASGYSNILIQDAFGTPSVTETATISGGGTWGAVGVNLVTVRMIPRSASPNGTGTLRATARMYRITVTTALSGSGSLTATGFVKASRSVPLIGAGRLTTTAQMYQIRQVIGLVGQGTLSGIARPKFSVVASLSGQGMLTASAYSIRFKIPLMISGTGTLAASTSVQFPRPAPLGGQGVLSGSTQIVAITFTATIRGSGRLSGSLIPRRFSPAGTSGRGVLSATAVPRFAAHVGLTGRGVLSATARIYSITTAGSLVGHGTLVVQAWTGELGYLSGTGALTATTRVAVFFIPLPLSGRGQLTAKALAAPTGRLVGHGQLTATTMPKFSRAALLAGRGALAATLKIQERGRLTGNGALSAATTPVLAATGALLGAGVLSATAWVITSRSANLSGQGSLSGQASLYEVTVIAAVLGAGVLSAQRSATLTAPQGSWWPFYYA